MKIITDFPYANTKVLSVNGNDVYMRNELRGTDEDWFYWMFALEAKPGETFRFHLAYERRLGYWGPAVSTDGVNWSWLGADSVIGEHDGYHGVWFTYTFPENAKRVYLCHDIHYPVERFESFALDSGLRKNELCVTEKHRSCPYYKFGHGKKTLFFTSRHHACESTGTYVLEGLLSYLTRNLSDDYSVVCVPFVDYDGVVDGDQGKARWPHDHNRDYVDGLYSTVRAIKELATGRETVVFSDFHSPWQCGGAHDKAVLCCRPYTDIANITAFSRLLEQESASDSASFRYRASDNLMPGQGWVSAADPKSEPALEAVTFMKSINENILLDLVLETSYFGTPDNVASADAFLALGKAYARALIRFLNSK